MEELNNLYTTTIFFLLFSMFYQTKTIIAIKWVFNTKKNENNKIIKRKAWLVACGFNQRRGIDYKLTYFPTLNIDCVKLIFAVSAKTPFGLFNNSILNQCISMPTWTRRSIILISQEDNNFGRRYWRLNIALYRLKQSGRQRNKTITIFLQDNGWK